MIFGVAFSAEGLAEWATRCSTWRAAVIGVTACVAQTVAVLAAEGGTLSEPYRDLGDYVTESVRSVPVAVFFDGLIWVTVFVFVALPFESSTPTPTRRMLIQRIIYLSPVTTLVPGVAWSIFAALEVFADCDFTGPGGKPAWLTSSAILFMGSSLWLLVGLGYMGVASVRACRRLDALLARPRCRRCFYDLTGNTSGVCPECGEPVDPRPMSLEGE